MKRLLFTKTADADVQSAFEWYERQREGLGIEFLDRVDQAVGNISRNPEMPPVVMDGDIRRVNMKQFPYGVWYRVTREVLVVGVLHGNRDLPAVIRQRREVQ